MSQRSRSVCWIEFFKTGHFGPLSGAFGQQDVLAVFGAPPTGATMGDGGDGPSVWKYGDIEFHFFPGEPGRKDAWMIFTDHFGGEELRGAGGLELESAPLRAGSSPESVEAWLGLNDVTWSAVDPKPHAADELSSIRTAGGVTLTFRSAEGLGARIDAMIYEL